MFFYNIYEKNNLIEIPNRMIEINYNRFFDHQFIYILTIYSI